MSDLSRLLDDLYSLPETDTESDLETEAPPRAPEWSSEEALDEVFASWVPGPSDDASAAERSMVAGVSGAPFAAAPIEDSWLVDTEPVLPEPVAETVAVAPLITRWSPSDDDILPKRFRRGKRR